LFLKAKAKVIFFMLRSTEGGILAQWLQLLADPKRANALATTVHS